MERMVLVLAVAAGTYMTRVVGFYLGNRTLTPALDRFLAYVPVAAFSALIVPGLELGSAAMLPRLIGVGVAALAVIKLKQLWAGILAGMAAFWIAGALL